VLWASNNNGIETAQSLGSVGHKEISDSKLDHSESAGKTHDFAFVFFA